MYTCCKGFQVNGDERCLVVIVMTWRMSFIHCHNTEPNGNMKSSYNSHRLHLAWHLVQLWKRFV
ncbi:hypothetical protein HanIR_Chr11g0511921 [Helianthus annuus]|nr:hypothetical protein HanIR_Chr11g0511921 [Helianthus annuus]